MSLADIQSLVPARRDTAARLRAALTESRALFRLALPIALIALVNMGMSVTDTLMVSQMFGTGALAAVAVGSDLYSILFYFCAGIIGGVTPFYTAAVTRGDTGGRQRLLRQGWGLVFLLAALAVPAIWTAPAWLATFGLTADLLAAGEGYTRAMALTLVPMLGVTLYRTVLTAAEKPKVFLKVTLAMLPLNAAANFLFMTGLGPLPAWGPAGAGIASLLVALTSLGLLFLIGRRADPYRPAGCRPAGITPNLASHRFGDVLRIGIPIGIATVTEVGIYLAATLYAARLGAADVAAHTLALRTAGIAYAVPTALLQAAMVRMARVESLPSYDARREAGRAVAAGAIGLGLLCGIALLLLLLGAALPLSGSFFDGSAAGIAAAGIALLLLVILGGIEGIACPGLAIAGLLRGRKDTRKPMLYTLAGYWLIGAPIGLILCEGLDQGIVGIWLGLAAGTFATAALNALRFARS